jgi:hypothetical protein
MMGKRRAALARMERVIKRAEVTQGITPVHLSPYGQARVAKWIRDRLIDWPSTSCLYCRKPIIVGQLWAVVSNGEVTARFHQNCHSEWLEQQEVAARRVLGLAL